MKRCLNCMEEYDEDYGQCTWCGYKQTDHEKQPQVLLEGSILQGRYIVGACLRIRGCDITYIGWDALFERKIQIQEFFPSRCANRAEGGSLTIMGEMADIFSENLSRFVDYHKNLIRLYREADIVCTLGCFKANGTAYAVTAYSADATLEDFIDGQDGIGLETTLEFLYQALEAVKKVHGLGLVHGAIRLSSFWVTKARKLILKDFAEPCHYCGNPTMKDYQDVGPWIDVYGLSMLFGKMLIGWEDVSLGEVLDALETGKKGLPSRLVLAVKGGLDVEKGHRIRSLGEYRDMIFADSVTMRLISHGEGELEGAGVREGGRVRRQRRVVFWGLSGMGACLIVLAALLILKHAGLIF